MTAVLRDPVAALVRTAGEQFRSPLSPVHAMLPSIERAHDARHLNAIVNDPAVLPLVQGQSEGPLDLSAIVANPANVALIGDHGAALFARMQIGLYEAHVPVLPSAPAGWGLAFARAAFHWLFTRTEAVEVTMRAPQPNPAMKRLAETIGARLELTDPKGWFHDGNFVSADIYRLIAQDWIATAPGLTERGRWFHTKLSAEYARHGRQEPSRPSDAAADRHIGAAVEMMMAGQPDKGAVFWNRYAAMANCPSVVITSYRPVTVDIRDALIVVRNDDFWVALVKPGAH